MPAEPVPGQVRGRPRQPAALQCESTLNESTLNESALNESALNESALNESALDDERR
jgi:hypothetical protein